MQDIEPEAVFMQTTPAESSTSMAKSSSPWELFLVFLRLGLTSFGGPAAHLGYFRDEFVRRRQWLDEHTYSDIVALCQFLPGPGSSQVGIAIGRMRGGIAGAIAAWLGFTLPSVMALVAFAYGYSHLTQAAATPLLHGLKVAAVAVVAYAVWSMAVTLCPDKRRATFAVFAAILVSTLGATFGQILAIVLAGLAGAVLLKSPDNLPIAPLGLPGTKRGALACLALFVGLLFGLPVLAQATHIYWLGLLSGFYRVGSLVFGGGHVVLPLLQAVVIPPGWVTSDQFLAGYGAAQAIPGPLFTFAAFLGAISGQSPSGPVGATVATLGIFLPSFLLVGAALPLWGRLREFSVMRQAMTGINAAVVGILLAALYDPVWTSSIHTRLDFCLAALAALLLAWWRVPSWAVVLITAVAAYAVATV